MKNSNAKNYLTATALGSVTAYSKVEAKKRRMSTLCQVKRSHPVRSPFGISCQRRTLKNDSGVFLTKELVTRQTTVWIECLTPPPTRSTYLTTPHKLPVVHLRMRRRRRKMVRTGQYVYKIDTRPLARPST